MSSATGSWTRQEQEAAEQEEEALLVDQRRDFRLCKTNTTNKED